MTGFMNALDAVGCDIYDVALVRSMSKAVASD